MPAPASPQSGITTPAGGWFFRRSRTRRLRRLRALAEQVRQQVAQLLGRLDQALRHRRRVQLPPLGDVRSGDRLPRRVGQQQLQLVAGLQDAGVAEGPEEAVAEDLGLALLVASDVLVDEADEL